MKNIQRAIVICLGVSLCLGVRFLQKRAERLRGGNANAQALFEEAQTARQNGDLERALELYGAAVQANPQMVPAYLEASTLLQEMDRGDEALNTLTRGVEANPNEPDIHIATAGTALLLKKMDTAQKEVGWMQQEMPEQPLTLALTGILLVEQGLPYGVVDLVGARATRHARRWKKPCEPNRSRSGATTVWASATPRKATRIPRVRN